jgi:hypothetical protein
MTFPNRISLFAICLIFLGSLFSVQSLNAKKSKPIPVEYSSKDLEEVIRGGKDWEEEVTQRLSSDGWLIQVKKKKYRIATLDEIPIKGTASGGFNYYDLVSISDDGKTAVTLLNHCYLATWDLETRQLVKMLLFKSSSFLGASSQVSNLIAMDNSLNDSLSLVDMSNGQPRWKLLEGVIASSYHATEFSPDGLLVCASYETYDSKYYFSVWNTKTGKRVFHESLTTESVWIAGNGFSDGAKFVYFTGTHGKVSIFDTENWEYHGGLVLEGGRDQKVALGLSPDGRYLSTKFATFDVQAEKAIPDWEGDTNAKTFYRGEPDYLYSPDHDTYVASDGSSYSLIMSRGGYGKDFEWESLPGSDGISNETRFAVSSNRKHYALLDLEKRKLHVVPLKKARDFNSKYVRKKLDQTIVINKALSTTLEMSEAGFVDESAADLLALIEKYPDTTAIVEFGKKNQDVIGYVTFARLLLTRNKVERELVEKGIVSHVNLWRNLMLFGGLASTTKNFDVLEQAIHELERVYEEDKATISKNEDIARDFRMGIDLLKALLVAGKGDYDGAYSILLKNGFRDLGYFDPTKRLVVDEYSDLFAPLYHNREKLLYMFPGDEVLVEESPSREYAPQAFVDINGEAVTVQSFKSSTPASSSSSGSPKPKKAKVQILD